VFLLERKGTIQTCICWRRVVPTDNANTTIVLFILPWYSH
jgi:hypothetical protein